MCVKSESHGKRQCAVQIFPDYDHPNNVSTIFLLIDLHAITSRSLTRVSHFTVSLVASLLQPLLSLPPQEEEEDGKVTESSPLVSFRLFA